MLGTDPATARDRIAYVAQEKPLHPQLTIADTLRLGAELNPGRWDARVADRVVQGGELDPGARIRTLSGGQRHRVALALALGKRPELMLLDEPMADLDPLARHQLMGTLLAEAVEHGTTVVMSSHIIGELTDACDHLLLVSGGRIRLGGGIDDLVDAHALVTGLAPAKDLAPHTVVEARATGRGTTALIRPDGPVVSRELEAGLHRLAWTQSISPARWLASKLATAATLAVAGALALVGVFRLGASGLLGRANLSWSDRGVYEALGPALVAYCLLGVAVGALVRLLVRRTLSPCRSPRWSPAPC